MGGVVRAETISQWFSYTGSERLLPRDYLFIYLFIFSLLFAYFGPTPSQIITAETTHLKKTPTKQQPKTPKIAKKYNAGMAGEYCLKIKE